MTPFSYSVDEARKLVADAGLVAHEAPSGAGLIIYDGDSELPSTWTEIDRIAVRDGHVASISLMRVLGN